MPAVGDKLALRKCDPTPIVRSGSVSRSPGHPRPTAQATVEGFDVALNASDRAASEMGLPIK